MALFCQCLIIALVLLLSPLAHAAPDTTLSITPSATAGTTIAAADENDRNNDIVTWANAHDHNDIDQTANTVNLGDGTAGDKTLTANAADSSDLSIRFDDSEDLWVAQQGSTTYNTIATLTDITGIASHGVVIGNGVGALTAVTPGTSGQLLQSQGPTANPAWVNAIDNEVGSFNLDISQTSTQTISSASMTATAVNIICGINGSDTTSIGWDDTTTVYSLSTTTASHNWIVDTDDSIRMEIDGSNFNVYEVTTFTATGFTLNPAKTGTPTGTANCVYFLIN